MYKQYNIIIYNKIISSRNIKTLSTFLPDQYYRGTYLGFNYDDGYNIFGVSFKQCT